MASNWEELRARCVIYEDAVLLALNKPAGLSVTGDNVADDLVGLAASAGEDIRPVHRIDKVTSGLILFAKTAPAHAELARQLNRHEVNKQYLAVVEGAGLSERGTIELPLTTGRKNRVRVAAQREDISHHGDVWAVPRAKLHARGRVYPSTTLFTRLWEGEGRTLLAVRPVTGRRHQIRVHLAWIGYPVAGDPLFTPKDAVPHRALLHSWRLAFDALDVRGDRIEIEATPDAGFREDIPMDADTFVAALERADAGE